MEWEIISRRGIPWAELEQIEKLCHEKILSDRTKRFLILSEPEPTYTYGRNSKATDLLVPKEDLNASGVVLTEVPRGGKWTYHGPGQLLVFPMFHLPTFGYAKLGVRTFMDRFRESARAALLELGIDSKPGECPYGLFIHHAKLASFGLRFLKGISTHGMAVYITPQHEPFSHIHPCGIAASSVTSVDEQVPQLSWTEVAEKMTKYVKNGLNLR